MIKTWRYLRRRACCTGGCRRARRTRAVTRRGRRPRQQRSHYPGRSRSRRVATPRRNPAGLPDLHPAADRRKVAAQQKDLLRDLIDNSLLVQRGKDMGINVDTDVVKRLDEIRLQNNIASMEDLEKQVTQVGIGLRGFQEQYSESADTAGSDPAARWAPGSSWITPIWRSITRSTRAILSAPSRWSCARFL